MDSRKLLRRSIWCEPADINHFLVVAQRVYGHWHVVVGGNNLIKYVMLENWISTWKKREKKVNLCTNLLKVFTEPTLQQLGIFIEEL